ncbi:olfactory receptor-like protein OLF2 [Artibeus jamaicensis]|uniref:olfactory receptor-like protein OLF2 n=1 Tax=Artibeus jamaicensis TaxID=9417 RepID=UPI00235B2BAF|nr:olfactory receptor-like protein OLF2 [Artibeus jamaicensis]
MAFENCTIFTDFKLLGLSGRQDVQQVPFVLFLLVYGITVITNLGMILLINMDPQLHTPMYYFLSNLSFSDVCYPLHCVPQIMADFLSQQKKIAYNLCAVQMFVFGTFVDVECVMQSVIAYDHYVAICNPLLYTTAMSGRVCTKLMAIVYIQSLVYSAIFTYCTTGLSFCNSNIINHFFCDFPPLFALSTSDTTINEIVMFTYSSCVLGFSIVTVLLSYSYIVITILRMKSAKGRHKAFSTCASHLTTVAMFYGILLFMYFQPSSSHSMDTDKVACFLHS